MTAIKNGTLLVKDSNGNTARVATLSQTDITTLNTALTDIEANKRKISSISANYVTTNTEQTISKNKVFVNQEFPFIVKDARFDNSVAPTKQLFNSIVLKDKNDKNTGMVQFEHGTSGYHSVRIPAIAQNAAGNNIYAPLTVGIKSDGTTSTSAPSPASNSNDSSIATTAWVNNKVNSIKDNYVTTTTQQDITGLKVFNRSSNGIICKEETMDVNVVPTSEIQNSIRWQDKNAHDVGMVKSVHETGNWHRMEMTAIAQDSSGNNIYGQLAVSIKPDGSIRTSCPQPPVNSNDTSIATTNWSNSRYVNLTDHQFNIAGNKYFTDVVCSKLETLDYDNVQTGQTRGFVGVDKKGRFISGITSGFYKNDTGNASFLRLLSAYNKGNDPNGVIAEFQKNLKDNTKWNYATSFLDHQTLDHIATIGWVYQRANINDIVAWKIANGLCISVVQLVTVAGQMSTYTYPIPYAVTPVTVGCVLGIISPNANTVPQYYCSISDITPTSFKCGFMANGYLGQGLISIVSIGVPA